VIQQGQVFQLKRRNREGEPLCAYRYRLAGRGSRRVQRGGFVSEKDAAAALERELDRVGRERRIPRSLTLRDLVDTYLAQHDVQPVTIEKLSWLLSKAIAVFGDRRVGELTSQEIAECPQAWVQTRIVHLIRQSLRFVPDKHRRPVAADLKPIYTANVDAAAEALAQFEASWGERYPMIGKTWRHLGARHPLRSTSRSSTPRRAGARPTTGRRRCSRSRSTSETDCPDPLTQEVGVCPAVGGG